MESVWVLLERKGWIRKFPSNGKVRRAYTYRYKDGWIAIFFRFNGIDMQLIPGDVLHGLNNDGRLSFVQSIQGYRTVRHSLSHSTDNLYEMVTELAECLSRNMLFMLEDDYFWKPQGNGDRRTEELKLSRSVRDGEESLYSIFGRDGIGPTYVGDGLWLRPGGGWHND